MYIINLLKLIAFFNKKWFFEKKRRVIFF